MHLGGNRRWIPLFFQRDSIPILVSRTVKTRKFKLLYFRNETSYGNGNLYKDLFLVYLQPSVNKNSQNLAIFTLQFDDVTDLFGIKNFTIIRYIGVSWEKKIWYIGIPLCPRQGLNCANPCFLGLSEYCISARDLRNCSSLCNFLYSSGFWISIVQRVKLLYCGKG